MNFAPRNAAKRFIVLVDTLYEIGEARRLGGGRRTRCALSGEEASRRRSSSAPPRA